MKLRTIQTTIITACLCTCMAAFTGCSAGANEPYEMPSGDSSFESSSGISSESSEMSDGGSLSESGSSKPQTGSKPQSSSDDEYPEITLNHAYLETVEGDILDVNIYLRVGVDALRTEFEEKYPELVGNDNLYYHYWHNYLSNYKDRISQEFIKDYDVDVESLTIMISGSWRGKINKEILSSMLDDPRVAEIDYYPNGCILDYLEEF